MSQRLRIPRALAATLVLAFVGIGAVGCAKKLTGTDPSLTPPQFPEGVRASGPDSPSDLVVWPDVPNQVTFDYADPTQDVVLPWYRSAEGATAGVVLDYVGSSGYQMFRRESGGGFRRYLDFELSAARRWAQRHYFGTPGGTLVLPPSQFFAFVDPATPPIATPAYIGRSVVAGISSASSALTNLGEVSRQIQRIPLRADVRDSLVGLQWDPATGAAGYWVHIYQFRNDLTFLEELIETTLLSPIATGKVRDLFIGYFPAPITGYKLGDPVPTGARVLVYNVLEGGRTVFIRVTAVDAAGQLVGTIDDRDEYYERRVEELGLTIRFPFGADSMTIQRPGTGEEGVPSWATASGADRLLRDGRARLGRRRIAR